MLLVWEPIAPIRGLRRVCAMAMTNGAPLTTSGDDPVREAPKAVLRTSYLASKPATGAQISGMGSEGPIR
jgi:hypothetical protein